MPKKFSFALQNILKYRQNMENDRAIKLNNKKNILQTEKHKLQDINNLKDKFLGELKKNSNEKFNILSKKISSEYVSQINNSISVQKNVIKNAKKSVNNARENLQEEIKKKKILEKLKERDLEEFKINMKRKEEKDNSEIALRKSFYDSY